MRQVAVVAHRGASGDFPENTASAFLEAIRLGVEMIEFDVQLSRDRELVIIHDSVVDRISDGSGRVDEMNLTELKELDAGFRSGGQFAGERFLTLEETLDLMPKKMRLNVHIKASDENREVLAPRVARELVRRNLLQTAFVTGSELNVVAARRRASGLEICTNQPVSRCVEIGCRILQPANGITTPELVEEAHRHGMEVNPFYADEEAEMRRLIDCGVDGILTNYPRKLQVLLDSAD
ncbi:MAG: hypothetical protein HOC74_19580 [Gemmatimonadetes bacterium]|jgi:glycerophosphoryl diester phosphodiesterase|nr:hypothetical protein [Gemmatimonadota bacterium]